MRGVFLSQVSCAKAEMDDHKPLVNFDSFLMAPQPRPALKPSLAPLCTQEQSQTLPGPPASSTTKLLEFGSLLFLCVAPRPQIRAPGLASYSSTTVKGVGGWTVAPAPLPAKLYAHPYIPSLCASSSASSSQGLPHPLVPMTQGGLWLWQRLCSVCGYVFAERPSTRLRTLCWGHLSEPSTQRGAHTWL